MDLGGGFSTPERTHRGLIGGVENMLGGLTDKLKGITDMIPKIKGPERIDKKPPHA